jgi:hypothetical protein
VDKDFDSLLSFLIVVPFFLVGLPTLPNCVPFFSYHVPLFFLLLSRVCKCSIYQKT